MDNKSKTLGKRSKMNKENVEMNEKHEKRNIKIKMKKETNIRPVHIILVKMSITYRYLL